jgi:putative heme degradation protein
MIQRTDPNDPRPSLTGNPLVASVLRENVHVAADGRATIGLWRAWPSLLAGIPAFGRVLAISRNLHAVLGRISEYPEVDSVPCGHCGCAVDGSLEFDFTSWQRAVAIVEARPDGWLYAIEFSDFSGEVIHKVCLTEQSDFEAFRSWVELNQTTGGTRFDCRNSRCNSLLENTMVLGASGAELLRSEALCVFFQMAAAERSAFRAIVGNDGAVQIAQVSPTIFRKNGQWIFAGDESSGIHVRVERLAEIFLHDIGGSLALKACDQEGRLVCAVAPPHDLDFGPWNAKLRGLAEEFPTDQP